MRNLLLTICLSAHGCVTPVQDHEWLRCEMACVVDRLSEVREVCHSFFRGLGCTCYDESTLWLEAGGI